jgi:hypothetical protein
MEQQLTVSKTRKSRRDETGREWTVNVHKLKRFNKRPFLNTVEPLEEQEATPRTTTRLEVDTTFVDRARYIELRTCAVSANGLASHGAEGTSSTDALDEIVSYSAVSKAPLIVPQGPPPSLRHLTGETVQERGRRVERIMDKSQDNTLEQLREYEVKQVLSHKRRGKGRGHIY